MIHNPMICAKSENNVSCGQVTVPDSTTSISIPVDKKYEHVVLFPLQVGDINPQSLYDEYDANKTGWQYIAMTGEINYISTRYFGSSFLLGDSSASVLYGGSGTDGAEVGKSYISFTESSIEIAARTGRNMASKFIPGTYGYVAW